ncbi:MAG: hypothetical protein AAGF24_05095 [Cyanobacteria bacterium P01_H01_bin.121]
MTTAVAPAPSFLRDAFGKFAQYQQPQKQAAQQQALQWLQQALDTEVVAEFTRLWRGVHGAPAATDAVNFGNLPTSYKGTNSISSHQEAALAYLQEHAPEAAVTEFEDRWSNSTKLDTKKETVFKAEDGTEFAAEKRTTYIVYIQEEVDEETLKITFGEALAGTDQVTWFVTKADVKIASKL